MPRRYKKKKALNDRLKGGRSRGTKGYFRPAGSTNKYYHAKVPRTLQIATRRYKSQMLRFVVNHTYKCTPQIGNPVVGPENVFLQFRANSIHDICNGGSGNGSVNIANTWVAQDASTYGPGQNMIHADGYEEWKDRFQHFTVLGSRIQATCQSLVGVNNESSGTFYLNLAGATGNIVPTSQAYEIMKLPYTKRARIFSAVSQAPGQSANVPGARLALNYSTKKFEGVTDVMDNQNLRGSFTNGYGAGGSPSETSFYTLGYVPTMTYNVNSAPCAPAIITVKIEYIVKLTEPTETNQVSA